MSVRLFASRKIACPVCGKTDGCLLIPESNAVVCLRIATGCATRADGTPITARKGLGYVHRMGPNTKWDQRALRDSRVAPAKRTESEWKDILKQHRSDLTQRKVKELSDRWMISGKSLLSYGIGYDAKAGCPSFPMFDGRRRPIGIRLEYQDGQKRCILGSQNGLFIPKNFELVEGPYGDPSLLLATPEGTSDCCAAYDLGLRAIGRPSNMGGVQYVRQLLSSGPKQDVVVLADHEETMWRRDGTPFWPGWEGALDLADAILPVVASLRVCKPPDRKKDIRKWMNDGGLPLVLGYFIANQDYADKAWITQKIEQVNEWREKLRRPDAQTGMVSGKVAA